MLKVLLVSPLDPDVPSNLKFLMGGENTYTTTLLANSPKGVKYIHHCQALKDGSIEYLPIHKFLAFLVKFRVLPLSSGTQALLLKDDFDLIHAHAYSVKVITRGKIKRKIPIILSDSSSNYLFLRDYLKWPEWKIKSGYILRKFLFEKLNIFDSDTNLENVSKLIVFSKFAAKIHEDLGVLNNKLEVVYPGLPNQKFKSKGNKDYVNILFVGIWFERKGGPILLEAFEKLVKKYPEIRLIIVGPVDQKYQREYSKVWEKINQKDFVPRNELLKEFFPKADIFVLVPPKVEGYGFVVQEAASFGIPAVVSQVCALPEIVEDSKTGFVVKPGNLEDLIEKLEILIRDSQLRKKLGKAASEKFNKQFAIESFNQRLLKIYEEALKT